MKNKLLFVFFVVFFLCACHKVTQDSKKNIISALQNKYISDNFESYMVYQPDYCSTLFDNIDVGEIDARYCDISKVDFTKFPEDILNKLSFNSKTVFPAKMPDWFDLNKIDKIGKTPGLNVKKLHAKGITGKGVGLAIIDQPLSSHQEYKDNLVYYKNFTRAKEGNMHGAAVSSIAVGKNIGVAPGADLYFIAAKFKVDKRTQIFDAGPIAEAINHILELNKTLPKENKIAVISISRGFNENDKDADKFQTALQNAQKENILVLTTNDIMATSRNGYYANPDDSSLYTHVPTWWIDRSFLKRSEDIFVPIDYRITACETGESDYAYYADGGFSWGVPYLAGVAALAKQAKPDLKMKDFISLAIKNADSILVKESTGEEYTIKYFINPTRLIENLKK